MLGDVESIKDLLWVDAQPIAQMADDWVSEGEKRTYWKLANRVSAVLDELGHARVPHSIQPILRGWKGKTRGFVYRAVAIARWGEPDASVPEAHLLEAPRKIAAIVDCARARSDAPTLAPKSDPAVRFLLGAREYAAGAVAKKFIGFMAFRAECLFGIPRRRAEAIIRGRGEVVLDLPG